MSKTFPFIIDLLTVGLLPLAAPFPWRHDRKQLGVQFCLNEFASTRQPFLFRVAHQTRNLPRLLELAASAAFGFDQTTLHD